MDGFCQLNAIRAFQSEIGNDEVRFYFSDKVHRFARAARFTANCKAVVGVKQLDEAVPEKGMIVYHHDPN
jgi:hypothetical protein